MCTIVDTSLMVLTGSSDRCVHTIQALPAELCGVVAEHSNWPVERVAVGIAETSEMSIEKRWTLLYKAGRKQVAEEGNSDDDNNCNGGAQLSRLRMRMGSVGHDVLKLTDFEAFFSPCDKWKEAEDEDDESSTDDDQQMYSTFQEQQTHPGCQCTFR
ncbi:hypothetical protein FISHEDRAFT_78834 [Fistulina hepatica ATCC 64428]|uniref:Uncharacterized protein n=1 Tax=Fistulina hepatica ATCC 64428 TaxID=1128425 RepID=A0A0D6ZZZ1_9AGAR|nr:hypothetical protein FISHEDRAFT_78834 [Fistulina hepatica ATCC 64428]